ncbi:Os11g0556466, partial [Oryza sativa Japonica Group]
DQRHGGCGSVAAAHERAQVARRLGEVRSRRRPGYSRRAGTPSIISVDRARLREAAQHGKQQATVPAGEASASAPAAAREQVGAEPVTPAGSEQFQRQCVSSRRRLPWQQHAIEQAMIWAASISSMGS